MKRLILAVSAVIAISACVSTNATVLGTATSARAKIDPATVRVFRTADQVKAKYEEVALLNASGESGMTNESKMVTSMRNKAASLGANGIILDAISEPSAGAKIAGAFFGTGSQRKGKAIAIYIFPDGSAKP